jgi:TrmH family RNA methyltransferase
MIWSMRASASKLQNAGGHKPDARLGHIAGRHNSQVKELRRSFARNELTEDGYCAIESLRIIEEAIRSGLRFRAVFFSESGQSKAARLLPQIGSRVETLLVPDKLFSDIVPSGTPQGVAAIVRWKQFALDEILAKSQSGPIIAVAGVQDPGNVGTIIRSAEAFGSAGVILGEGTASPFNSKVVRASAGSIFRLPLVRVNLTEAVPQMRGRGIRLLATSSHKGTALDDAKPTAPIAVFIGAEGAGLPRELMRQMDGIIAIPHLKQVESLNAGVAASIVLYEIARQAKSASSVSGNDFS